MRLCYYITNLVPSRMPFLMPRFIINCLLILCVSTPVSAAPLKVVTSIYPLQLIAESVLGSQAEVVTLLTAGQSPHNFALKVSDRRKLADADLVLWVGPTLEPYLADITSSHPSLAMSEDAVTDSSSPHQPHSHGTDPHLWLSVQEVESFTRQLIELMKPLDRVDQTDVTENAERFIGELRVLTGLYKEEQTPKPYAVAHRAYDHFLQSFAFPEPIVLSDSPEISPGARTLWRASESLDEGSCLIVDGSNSQRWLQAFAQRNQLEINEVDLMGVRSGVRTYKELIESLAEVFKKCSGEISGEEKTPALFNK